MSKRPHGIEATLRVTSHRTIENDQKVPVYIVKLQLKGPAGNALLDKATLVVTSENQDLKRVLPVGEEFVLKLAVVQTQLVTSG